MANVLCPTSSVIVKKITEEEHRKLKATEYCKKLFDSVWWHYPVHQFIGDIVRS